MFANALQNGFAGDDIAIVRDNPYIRGLHNAPRLLFGSYWPDSAELYRPTTLISFALDWMIAGGSPAWMHAVNVLLHAAATGLVLLLLARLGAPTAAGVLGALVFAVHPVHVEAVASLVGRADLLAAALLLLACHLHLAPKVRPVVRIAGIALLYLLALGAKEAAVMLPALLLALDAVRRDEPRHRTVLMGVLAATLGVFLALRHGALGEVLGSAPAPYLIDLPPGRRLATAVRLWPEYLRLLFWPADLSAEWGPGAIAPTTWADPAVWLGLLIGAGTAAAAWLGWSRNRWVWLAVVWFALTVLPVSQIFFPTGVLLAERLLYLPSVALAFLAPPLAMWMSGAARPIRIAAASGFVVLLALGSWRTWQRTPAWQSNDSFAAALHRDHPDTYRSLWLRADERFRKGDLKDAAALYARAVALTDGYQHNLNVNYSGVLLALGRAAEVEALMSRSIPRQPRNPAGYALLSMSLLQQGQPEYALQVLEHGRQVAAMSPVAERRYARTAALARSALDRRVQAFTRPPGSVRR